MDANDVDIGNSILNGTNALAKTITPNQLAQLELAVPQWSNYMLVLAETFKQCKADSAASCRVSFWFVGSPESGRSETVKPPTCAPNLGTRCVESYCPVLIASGAELCVLSYPSRPHSQEHCLHPCGSLVLHVWKHVASQLMPGTSVDMGGKSTPARRTSRQHLKTAVFSVEGQEYEAIEQNQEKPSRWGQLARSGRQVVQFKDAERNKFVAVVVDGEVTFYGASKKRS